MDTSGQTSAESSERSNNRFVPNPGTYPSQFFDTSFGLG